MATLTVITGPMFSGKSEELIRRLKRATYANLKVLVLKPKIDTRTKGEIAAREKDKNDEFQQIAQLPAHIISEQKEALRLLEEKQFDVLAFDEVQFFQNWVINLIVDLLDPQNPKYNKNLKIIVTGLDMDAWRRPFGPIPHLMAIADGVVKLSAICFVCKKRPKARAIFSQKMGGTSKKVQVGDADIYQARCRECHTIPE